MTGSAVIDRILETQFRWVWDALGQSLRSSRQFPRDVISSWTMTSLAGNAWHRILRLKATLNSRCSCVIPKAILRLVCRHRAAKRLIQVSWSEMGVADGDVEFGGV
jgi:hypothetical protein